MNNLKTDLSRLYALCEKLSPKESRSEARQALDSLAHWVDRFQIVDRDLNQAAGRFFMEKDLELGCKYVSQSLQSVLGYSADDWMANPDSWLKKIHPDDYHRFMKSCVQEVLHDQTNACEYRMFAADGRTVWIRDVGILNCDQSGRPIGIFGSFLDITATKKLEEELQTTENRYRISAHLMRHAIWEWEMGSNKLHWGEGIMTHFLYPSSEINTDIFSWYDKIHPDDRERVVNKVHAFLDDDGNEWKDEYRFRSGDGAYHFVEDRGWIVRDETGKATRMIGGMTDITERKRIERERDESWEAEKAAQIETQQTVQTLNGLLDSIAHDLKNPLSNILLNISLLNRFRAKIENYEKIDPSLRRIKDSSDKMKSQIEDMLQIARARLNRLKLDRREHHLKEILKAIQDQAKPILQEAQDTLELRFSSQDVLLNVDQELFIKAVLSLVRFMTANGPKESTIVLQENYVNGEESIRVQNLNWELSEDRLKELMEKGSRDLTFSVAKAIISAHHGQIWIRSDTQGTVVAISVPSVSLNRKEILVAS